MGVGWFARSSTFRAGGHRWHIQLYPDGCSKHCAGSTSAFLVCVLGLGERHAPEVRTRFSLNVLPQKEQEQEGRPEARSDKLTDFPVKDGIFSPTADNKEFDYGYPVFFHNSKLVPSKHLDDDGCLTVRCVLTVVKNKKTTRVRVKKSAVVAPPPKPDLQEQLARMLKDGEGADVTFSVGGRLFPAHKCLLAARSPVFRAKLFGPTKEDSSTRCVQIDDVEPAIFEALLHFLYTDCMTEEYKEGETENLQHLLVAADRFGVDRLRVLCEGRLCNSINKRSVATTLVLAEQHGCKALRKACIKFMARSRATLRAVSETEGYSHLVASCPNLVLEILSVVEKHFFRYKHP
ncbi:hypothetical protein BRADI_5g22375v3 [Brachypodium distachyon]|uniref:BTB domain-containing protein n=1 Tax=Brachypodium distachyon TaxID=15368 RepID=A0A0Q3KX21_BRADI|nr:hypothetical protein BRADI_5g22375v3 [Brachypodium distachyon]